MIVYFQSLLTDEQVANAPVLILGNKIDKPGAASEDEIRHHFGLHGQTTGKVGEGIWHGKIMEQFFDWIFHNYSDLQIISQPNYMLWVLKRAFSLRWFF